MSARTNLEVPFFLHGTGHTLMCGVRGVGPLRASVVLDRYVDGKEDSSSSSSSCAHPCIAPNKEARRQSARAASWYSRDCSFSPKTLALLSVYIAASPPL